MEEITTAINKDKKSQQKLIDSGWRNIDKKTPSKDTFFFDPVLALSNESNGEIMRHHAIKEYGTTVFNGIKTTYQTELIKDENHNLMVVYNIESELNDNIDIDKYIELITNNRDIIENLNLKDINKRLKIKIINIAKHTLNILIGKDAICNEEIELTSDSYYPLIITKGSKIKDPYKLFTNEEDISRSENKIKHSQKHENFSYIGWNYALISNMPTEHNKKTLFMLFMLQTYFYQFRFYKTYFQNKMQNFTIINEISQQDLRRFEIYKMQYHKHILLYKTYKSSLYPKYYKLFSETEELWHMNDDIEMINQIFEVQNEYINKTYNDIIEIQGRKINAGLSIIAFLQLTAVYSIAYDAFQLHQASHEEIFLLTDAVVLALIALLSPFILTPIIKELLRKNNKKHQP